MLEEVLVSYDEFTREEGESPEQRSALAGAFVRVGEIRRRLGQHIEAASAFERALGEYQRLAHEYPEVARYSEESAAMHGVLAVVYAFCGRNQDAVNSFATYRDR